ncbi:MAG: hypothetical protein QOI36_4412 [Pseudonocardiales bacterium]|nr:hypothetical protein [Pseudonocardiales bacterium]
MSSRTTGRPTILSSCSWLDRASEEARQRYTPPAAAPSGPARRALAQHRKAADELARLDQEQRSTQLERDAVDLEPPPAGVLARRRHRRQRDRVAAEYDRFVAEAAGRRRGLLALQVEARTIIGTVTSAELDAADVRLAVAQAATAAADEELRRAQRELKGLRTAVRDARSHGTPTEGDRRLVTRCLQHDLPGRHQQLQELIRRQGRTAGQRGALEAELRTLVGRGAAALAEVLLALCRARTTAVLFGDFLQLGPVLEGIKDDPSPAVAKWILATCFSHAGINAPRDTELNGSCVALLHQFRFGPARRCVSSRTVRSTRSYAMPTSCPALTCNRRQRSC